jgi:hypothetical protein
VLVYYKGIVLKKADPKTFECKNRNFAKDKTNVYYEDKIIKGADPKTYKALKFPFSKDEKMFFII